MEDQIIDYGDFIKLLEDEMYRTIKHIRSSPNTNAVHYDRMFKKMLAENNKDMVRFIIDSGEYHKEWHPDSIELMRKMLN